MPAKKSKKTQNKDSIKKYKLLLEESQNKNIRLLAEFDNFKKRTYQESNDRLKYEGIDLVKEILPILDDLKRVFQIKDFKKNKSVYDGLKLLYDKFIKILSDNNIFTYESIGDEFNPDLHEALMIKKSKKKKNIILEEFQCGYKYHDKVIRHAKVIVSEK